MKSPDFNNHRGESLQAGVKWIAMKPLVVLLASCLIVAAVQAQAKTECTNKVAPLTHVADAVVLVEVEKIGSPPGFWSGQLAAEQSVTYRVIRFLKGQSSVVEFSVDYGVVHGSRLVETDTPELNHSLFKTRNRVIVFLRFREVRLPDGKQSMLFQTLSDDCSVLPASAATAAAVTREIGRTTTR